MALPEIPECVTDRENLKPTDQAAYQTKWPIGCASTCDDIDFVALGYTASEHAEYAGLFPLYNIAYVILIRSKY